MNALKKRLVLIGAGKIGCGYLADLFGQAGYSLTFLVHSPAQTEKMRAQGYYTLFVTGEQSGQTTSRKVSGYEAYCTQTERQQCIDALVETNYASLHTYPGAFADLADLLAAAIKKRCALGSQQPLDVLLCVNVTDAFEQFDAGIRAKLTAAEREYYEKYVGLVRTLTYRGGYIPKPEMLEQDALAVWASDYADLPVDQDGFRGEIPEGVNLRLMDKMAGRAVAKVWCGNVRSCILSMMSAKYGFTYTNQGARVPYIRKMRGCWPGRGHAGGVKGIWLYPGRFGQRRPGAPGRQLVGWHDGRGYRSRLSRRQRPDSQALPQRPADRPGAVLPKARHCALFPHPRRGLCALL